MVRSALDGDRAAWEWVVTRFSPLLLTQARYRMRARLCRLYDPEDVVADVWQRALPKLTDFRQEGSRNTPRMVRFLASIVIHRVNELLRRHAGTRAQSRSLDATSFVDPIPAHSDVGGLKALVSRERVTAIRATIESLEPTDQEIIVLRKIEGLNSQEVAAKLGISTGAVDTRLSRAMAKLRSQLPDSVFDELGEHDD